MEVVRTPRAGYAAAAPAADVPGLVLEFSLSDQQLSSWVARELVHAVQMRRRALSLRHGEPVVLTVEADVATSRALLPTDWMRVLTEVRADPTRSELHAQEGHREDQGQDWQQLELKPPKYVNTWRLRMRVQQ